MALVQELGVSPENIICISPCKQVSQIKYAAKVGVNIMTCDNEVELKKIARKSTQMPSKCKVRCKGIFFYLGFGVV